MSGLTIYEHPFASYCWKAMIALYERDVPFARHQVDDEADRAALAQLWAPASMPVLVDDDAGIAMPESTIVVEYLDRFGDAPPLIPAEPEAALRARLWDRVVDLRVQTPMQKVVLDRLRPEGTGDRHGVEEAREALGRVYALLDDQLHGNEWLAGPTFTMADCAAAPALHYARALRRWDEDALAGLTRYYEALNARPSVARVVDEARPYRPNFPLPWPDYMD
ncbi:MAG TPA: glutathione S-transferase family protein [Solirubrobacterales bacterium]|jgi:glutathione S-transferase|nr:glutathione S-transferase family protein [Solirubrobacterales bacterium]